jgi:MauM/NapG family ferredoxin protein
MMPSDTPDSRRRFFQSAARKVVGPLAEYLERRAIPHAAPPQPAPQLPVLRPPGAIDERNFATTCQRCGKCIDVCPADAIVAMPASEPHLAGTPFVDADAAACVICDGLQCTHVCPSGALRPLASPDEIDMGVAEVYDASCVRSNHESCTKCVDLCPIGPAALSFEHDGPPIVHADGCTGCGVCQLYCPTLPKAIVVRPK